MSGIKRQGGIRAAVLEYSAKRSGITIYVNDLMEITGFSKDQICDCISNITTAKEREGKDLGRFEPVVRGSSYIYHPPAPAKPDGDWVLMEVLAIIEDKKLLRTEDGRVGVWKPIEF